MLYPVGGPRLAAGRRIGAWAVLYTATVTEAKGKHSEREITVFRNPFRTVEGFC